MEFPDKDANLPKLPDDGKECPKCHKGIMKTTQITAKDGKKYIVLACRNGEEGCKNLEFPAR